MNKNKIIYFFIPLPGFKKIRTMKKLVVLFMLLLSVSSFSEVYENFNEKIEQTETGCKYKGRKLYRGKRGGCFYISNGGRVYVDRYHCRC